MSYKINDSYDPENTEKCKEKLFNNTLPCNISGLIKDMLKDIETIKSKLGV